MAKETTRIAIPLLGQLTHVHLESNPLQLGRHYQLDCRLLLPIRHWWTRSWSWNSSLRFVSSSCQLKFPLILKNLSLLFHLGVIWAVMLLSAAMAITLPKPSDIRTLVTTVILRLICSAGPQPTLMLLGTATVVLKGVHLLWASWATQEHSSGASDKSAPTRRLFSRWEWSMTSLISLLLSYFSRQL